MKARPNQYPENPWPPNTMAAAFWDLRRAARDAAEAFARSLRLYRD